MFYDPVQFLLAGYLGADVATHPQKPARRPKIGFLDVSVYDWLCGLMFYYLLYQTKLVPRWLSAWGLAGTAAAIVASCLFMFRSVDLMTSVYMNFPLALQEMVFAVWLIAKGVNPSAVASGVATTV